MEEIDFTEWTNAQLNATLEMRGVETSKHYPALVVEAKRRHDMGIEDGSEARVADLLASSRKRSRVTEASQGARKRRRA